MLIDIEQVSVHVSSDGLFSTVSFAPQVLMGGQGAFKIESGGCAASGFYSRRSSRPRISACVQGRAFLCVCVCMHLSLCLCTV